MKRICLSGNSRIHTFFRKGTALLCGALCLCLLCGETAAQAAEAGPPTTPGLSTETDPPSEEDSLVFGMKGDDVLKMQNALKDLGYPGFIPDGEFGENSRLAVQIFQFYNGLPVTGEADSETLTALYRGGACAAISVYSGISYNETGRKLWARNTERRKTIPVSGRHRSLGWNCGKKNGRKNDQ